MGDRRAIYNKICSLMANIQIRARILVQVTIYRRLRIGRDGHLDQSEAYDISQLVREYGPCIAWFYCTTAIICNENPSRQCIEYIQLQRHDNVSPLPTKDCSNTKAPQLGELGCPACLQTR